jgi:hypothetical protein
VAEFLGIVAFMKRQHLFTVTSVLMLGVAIVGCATRSDSSDERLRGILVIGPQGKPEQVQVHRTHAGLTDVTVSGVTNTVDKQHFEEMISSLSVSGANE